VDPLAARARRERHRDAIGAAMQDDQIGRAMVVAAYLLREAWDSGSVEARRAAELGWS
jgi:hypothetical protein